MQMGRIPEKTLGLRRDTLGMVLSLANVQPHARVLVVDGGSGLLSAAVAQRLGGKGCVLCAHVAHSFHSAALEWLNLPPASVQACERSAVNAQL